MSTATSNAPYAVIAGLGATGLSCARYLHAHGWRLAVTDSRAAPPQLAALTALDAHIPVRLGALAIGAAIGVLAVIVRQELVALVMGGVFVLETASVIIQVASYKLTGRRVFKMAPIHHHFELKGWAEPKVIVRFWIISLLLVLAGLATLKLR